MATLRGATPTEQSVDELDAWDKLTQQRGQPAEDLISIPIGEDPNNMVLVGSNLCEEDRQHLISFLRANADVFAMPGIDPEVIVHRLNVDTKYCPIRQKKCSFAPE